MNSHLSSHSSLNKHPSLLAQLDSCLDCGLGTGRVNDHVRAFLKTELVLDHLSHLSIENDFLVHVIILTGGGRGWLEDTIRRLHDRASHVQALGVDVNADDRFRTVLLGDTLDEKADGTTAEDDDRLTTSNLTHATDLHRTCHRLAESDVFQRQVRRKRIAVVRRSLEVSRECSIVRRGCCEYCVGAKVVRALAAITAASAGDTGFDCDFVTGFQMLDGAADGRHYACGFVAQNDRVTGVQDEISDPAALPVVHVGSANSLSIDLTVGI